MAHDSEELKTVSDWMRLSRRATVAGMLLLLMVLVCHGGAIAAQLALTWVDSTTNELGFSIERSTGTTGSFGQIATTGAGVTSYTDSTLTNATTYCYRVRAFNATAYSDYSNTACATTPTSTFGLAVLKTGTGSGTVTSSPSGIVCGSSCSASFSSGTTVILTETPLTGSVFNGWNG